MPPCRGLGTQKGPLCDNPPSFVQTGSPIPAPREASFRAAGKEAAGSGCHMGGGGARGGEMIPSPGCVLFLLLFFVYLFFLLSGICHWK